MELSSLERVLFLIAFMGAVSISAFKVLQTVARIRRGRAAGPLEKLGTRLKKTFLHVPLQMPLIRTAAFGDFSSLAHVVLFWGALILGLNCFLFLVLGDGLGLAGFLRGSPGISWLPAVTEWLALGVLAGMVLAAVRRLKGTPARLGPQFDGGIFTLVTINVCLLVLSMLISEGLRAYLNEGGYHAYLARNISLLFMRAGLQESTATALLKATWWVQAGSFLLLIIYAPFSGHRHPLYGPWNVFLELARHPRSLDPVDLEAGHRLGGFKAEHLTWKQLLDSLACTQCGRCQDVCPAYATGKPLSPKFMLMEVANRLEGVPSNGGPGAGLEAVYSCTTCGACHEVCPVSNRPLEVIMEFRRGFVYEGTFETGHRRALRHVSRDFNPLGYRWNRRAEFLHLKEAREDEHYDCLYWIGCLAAFDGTARKIAESTASILKKAGVNFGVLGVREACCGDFVRRLGDEGLFQELARKNIETLRQYDFDFILTHCPHCYNSLANEYQQFGGGLKVVHHSRLIRQLMDQGRIRTNGGSEKLAFHDSCYLSRYNNIQSPRKILTAVSTELVEFQGKAPGTFCCGAGGGHVWRDQEPGEKMSVARLKQLSPDVPDALITACPFCLMMFQEAALILEGQGPRRIVDLAELVANSLY